MSLRGPRWIHTAAGILVPGDAYRPTEIGLGCPLCDDHELIPVRKEQIDGPKEFLKFRKKHAGHGALDTLERKPDGRIYATGKLPDMGRTTG